MFFTFLLVFKFLLYVSCMLITQFTMYFIHEKQQKSAPDDKYTQHLHVFVFVDEKNLSEYTQIIYRLQITDHHP